MKQDPQQKQKGEIVLRRVLDLIKEKKGGGTAVLDLRDFSIPVSFFVITEGDNPKQVEAIAENILENFRGRELLHKEGLAEKRWVVLDYGDFMVHIFQRELRKFYDLEGLWGEVEVKVKAEEASEAFNE
jgi:ribosome-associated protein